MKLKVLLGCFLAVCPLLLVAQEVPKTVQSSCSGKSIDPLSAELEEIQVLIQAKAYQKIYEAYVQLAAKYPLSATMQVKAAGIALHHLEDKSALARNHYLSALSLHKLQCLLTEKDLWLAYEGIGLSYLAENNSTDAEAWFYQAAVRWPNIDELQYNLACAYCKNQKLDACYQAVSNTLQVSKAKSFPVFAKGKKVHFWIKKIAQDADLKLLREDSRYPKLIDQYRTGEWSHE